MYRAGKRSAVVRDCLSPSKKLRSYYLQKFREVLNRARALGILTFSMSSFFGSGIGYIINNVRKVRLAESEPVQAIHSTLKMIDDTLKHVIQSGNGANLQHLMRDFFQSLMFQLLSALYPGASIEQFEKLPVNDGEGDGRKTYEYDVIINSYKNQGDHICGRKGI